MNGKVLFGFDGAAPCMAAAAPDGPGDGTPCQCTQCRLDDAIGRMAGTEQEQYACGNISIPRNTVRLANQLVGELADRGLAYVYEQAITVLENPNSAFGQIAMVEMVDLALQAPRGVAAAENALAYALEEGQPEARVMAAEQLMRLGTDRAKGIAVGALAAETSCDTAAHMVLGVGLNEIYARLGQGDAIAAAAAKNLAEKRALGEGQAYDLLEAVAAGMASVNEQVRARSLDAGDGSMKNIILLDAGMALLDGLSSVSFSVYSNAYNLLSGPNPGGPLARRSLHALAVDAENGRTGDIPLDGRDADMIEAAFCYAMEHGRTSIAMCALEYSAPVRGSRMRQLALEMEGGRRLPKQAKEARERWERNEPLGHEVLRQYMVRSGEIAPAPERMAFQNAVPKEQRMPAKGPPKLPLKQ